MNEFERAVIEVAESYTSHRETCPVGRESCTGCTRLRVELDKAAHALRESRKPTAHRRAAEPRGGNVSDPEGTPSYEAPRLCRSDRTFRQRLSGKLWGLYGPSPGGSWEKAMDEAERLLRKAWREGQAAVKVGECSVGGPGDYSIIHRLDRSPFPEDFDLEGE